MTDDGSARRPARPTPWQSLGISEAEYWNRFYATRHADLEAPSSFAQWCMERLRPDLDLFELGCGNGRDARFFAERGLRVTACDRSDVAIAALTAAASSRAFRHPPVFLVADMASLPAPPAPLDVVYSRFTLHAVPADAASSALAWSHRSLAPGGRLVIEARSVAGSLYGKGTEVERDAFIHDGHYRRFLRRDELLAELTALGFTIDEAIESAGLAIYKDDDPVVIRVLARR
jgi:SAM-dependent methyltransferase